MPVNLEPVEGNGDLETAEEHVAYEAREVQLLLSKDAVRAAFKATEDRFVREWKRAENTPAREFCWAKIKALAEFQDTLRGWAERTAKLVS